jgi:hypothetical protein
MENVRSSAQHNIIGGTEVNYFMGDFSDTAEFARMPRRRGKKKKGLGRYVGTGAKYGAIVGGGLGALNGAVGGGMLGRMTGKGIAPAAIGGGIGGAAAGAASNALLGAGIGAGVYGAKKLLGRRKNRRRR